jgi:hypothetical protein
MTFLDREGRECNESTVKFSGIVTLIVAEAVAGRRQPATASLADRNLSHHLAVPDSGSREQSRNPDSFQIECPDNKVSVEYPRRAFLRATSGRPNPDLYCCMEPEVRFQFCFFPSLKA